MYELINEYVKVKGEFDKLKKLESELRVKLIDEMFLDQSEGTRKIEANGLQISASFGVNYRIDTDLLDDIYNMLSPEEQDCIKLKPSLVISAYKKLEERDMLDDCISVSPAMPSVKIKIKE
jgi:hypothetical protein